MEIDGLFEFQFDRRNVVVPVLEVSGRIPTFRAIVIIFIIVDRNPKGGSFIAGASKGIPVV